MAQSWIDLTSQLADRLGSDDKRKKNAMDRSWELNAALVRIEMAMSHNNNNNNNNNNSSNSNALASNNTEEETTYDDLVQKTILSREMYNNIIHQDDAQDGDESHPRAPRLSTLSMKIEEYAQYKAFRHFLDTGTLLSPDAPCFFIGSSPSSSSLRRAVTDEEYLGGACIGLCHELARYAVERAATALKDPEAVASVQRARDVINSVLEELLQFDFRNGPLRRKYDGTKYELKTVETILYELSVAGAVGGRDGLVASGDVNDASLGQQKKKKMRIEQEEEETMGNGDVAMEEEEKEDGAPEIIPKEGIAAIRKRMDHRDALRERLIKTCRDGQKAAKQAIFALHRDDSDHALKLLQQCEKCVEENLVPILKEEPTLRSGTFSSVLEEYVEGILFYTWLQKGEDGKPLGRILMHHELKLSVSPEEYLGGLCDLSGEIGRFAVSRGTKRDRESVKLCLDTNKSMHMALRIVGKMPGGLNKKMFALSKSVEKLERVMYELSLMEMTGREFASAVEESSRPEGNHQNNDDD